MNRFTREQCLAECLGAGLIEWIAAMALTSLLILTMIPIFLMGLKAYRDMDALLIRVQHRLIARAILTRALANTGQAWCDLSRLGRSLGLSVISNSAMPNRMRLKTTECIYYHNAYRYLGVDYFIDDTHRRGNHGEKLFGLYRKIEGSQRQELVERVTGLRAQVFVLGSAQPQSPETVKNWEHVFALDITLIHQLPGLANDLEVGRSFHINVHPYQHVF